MISEKVMTLEEAAQFLRVTRQTLSEAIRQGKLPAQKIGREYRILRTEVIRFLKGNHPEPTFPASVAILGTETLNAIEDFLFQGARPTDYILFEFQQFCDAVVLHDEVYVTVRKDEAADNPVLEAFSSFIKQKELGELIPRSGESEFRSELERELEIALGKDHPFISLETLASKGIKQRDRSAGALQEQLNHIIRNNDLGEVAPALRNTLRSYLDDPKYAFSSDTLYFLRTFLYNAVANVNRWSFLPNLARLPLLSFNKIEHATTPVLSLLGRLSSELVDLMNARRRVSKFYTPTLRSSVAYVVLDSSASANTIANVLLSWRDGFYPVREEFSRLAWQIDNAGTLADTKAALDALEEQTVEAFNQMDWSTDSEIQKHAGAIISSFLSSLRLSVGLSLTGPSVSIGASSAGGRVFKAASVASRLLPLVRFYRALAQAHLPEDMFRRLYQLAEPYHDEASAIVKRINEFPVSSASKESHP